MLTLALTQQATVYTANGSDGDFTETATTNLPCRLAHYQTTPYPVADERAEPAHRRRLMWGPDYTMPEPAQIAISGESGGDRWSVLGETVEGIRGLDGQVAYYRATCMRVLS